MKIPVYKVTRSDELDTRIRDHEGDRHEFCSSCRYQYDPSFNTIEIDIFGAVICLITNNAEPLDPLLRLDQREPRSNVCHELVSHRGSVLLECHPLRDVDDDTFHLEEHASDVDAIESRLLVLQRLLPIDYESQTRESRDGIYTRLIVEPIPIANVQSYFDVLHEVQRSTIKTRRAIPWIGDPIIKRQCMV